MDSSIRVAVGLDDEDSLSGARVEVDMESLQKKIGSAYAEFTTVPPNTTLEVEFLQLHLLQERRNGMDMYLLMFLMWKTIKAILTFMALVKKIPQLESKDFSQFLMLNEAWDFLECLKYMDFVMDATQSERSRLFAASLSFSSYL